MSDQTNSKLDGELSSIEAANSGSGAEVQEKIEKQVTVDDSKQRARKRKADTSTISQLDIERELTIFQSCIPRLVSAGIGVRVAYLHDQGKSQVILILDNCVLDINPVDPKLSRIIPA